MSARVHPTAIVEANVEIGCGTVVWNNAHLRGPSRIGRDCIIGEKSYLAYGVEVGDRVKINAFVYLPTGVTLEDGVMIAAGTVFTNDRWPRATSPDLATLRGSGPDGHTLPTTVRAGATIGARCVIGCGLEIGAFAMVGMGAVVTRSVPAFTLAVGHPARPAGLVCRCGQPMLRGEPARAADQWLTCSTCGAAYRLQAGGIEERDSGPMSAIA